MDSSPRFVLLVIILIFIFLTPDQQNLRRRYQFGNPYYDELKQIDFDTIANATYGDPVEGHNLTGFRSTDGYQWQLLQTAQDVSRGLYLDAWKGIQAPVYQRLNGEVHGSFIRIETEQNFDKTINLTALVGDEYLSHYYERNVTEQQGEIRFLLDDSSRDGSADNIKAQLNIFTESSPGNGWEAKLEGVHFPDGSALLTTMSRKFNSYPVFPLFALDEQQFNLSKHLMNITLASSWERISPFDVPTLLMPDCELMVWLHQRPQSGSPDFIKQVENELENPDGAPIGTPPLLAFSATIFSPDCGYVLSADTVYGPKAEAYWGLVQRLLAAFLIIVALQITLLKRQMEKCATPSTRSRISFYSIGIAAFGDGLILFAVMGLLMVDTRAFLIFAAAAFLCCMHVAFFEVKFIFDIWTVQVGDPAQAQRERSRRTVSPAESLPPPATARTDGATPVILPPDQDADPTPAENPRSSFASLYSKFYFALVNLMFFSLWAMSWPQSLRSAYVNLLAFCYFSLWWPQIYRNIIRNCRKALNWEYVLGSSILRAIPVLYWYVDENNVLSADIKPNTAYVLFAWLWLQIIILVSQQYLGPRLLVKDSWCPPAYDYHPPLYDDVEAGGLPIGALASASEGKDKDDKSRRVFDCAICMNEIDVPVMSKEENKGRTWLEQRNYMVTPCRHIFHTECLEGWMNLRLVCPVCREGLPPL